MPQTPFNPVNRFGRLVFTTFFFSTLFLLITNGQSLAVSRLGCLGAAAVEYIVPGAGYAFTKQWDKALVFGGARWITRDQFFLAAGSEHYQENGTVYRVVDADDSVSGKTETNIYMNKETWTAEYNASLNLNLLLISWADLYQNDCKINTETYQLMLSPFRFDLFYKKWSFWLPMAMRIASYATFSDNSKVEYFLQRGLTAADLKRDTFSQLYMVGIGEEMFFRGTVQHHLFFTLMDDWGFSAQVSRHLAVVGASAFFAAAHNGEGFAATPTGAFFFGLYEGYVYHPSLSEFDLATAIAIHAWWNILISYAILNHAEFTESQKSIRVPVFRIGFNF